MSVARADCDDRVARAQLHDDKPEPPLLRLGPLRATHKEQHRSQEAGGPYGQGEKRIVDEETGQLDYGREALPRAAPVISNAPAITRIGRDSPLASRATSPQVRKAAAKCSVMVACPDRCATMTTIVTTPARTAITGGMARLATT